MRFGPTLMLLGAVMSGAAAQSSSPRVSLDGEWFFAADSMKVGIEQEWFRESADQSG